MEVMELAQTIWLQTSAKPLQSNKRQSLTGLEWTFMDQHPSMGQAGIVNHFSSKADGSLIFVQGTLSRKISHGQRPKTWRACHCQLTSEHILLETASCCESSGRLEGPNDDVG